MRKQRVDLYAVSIGLLVLVLTVTPFVFAIQPWETDKIFNGFLFNPSDGNSYIAKMYQGWSGNWRFRLPFTAEPGEGAYLFLFYLGLGHLARILSMPLISVFHLARVLGCLVLLWVMWIYYGTIFRQSRPRKLAFALASLGSGMGWLLVPFGSFTSDFWVAETYPFLSVYANPHFPLGLAIVLWLTKPSLLNPVNWRYICEYAFWAIVLSLINPFGIVIVLMVSSGRIVWSWFGRTNPVQTLIQVIISAIFGLPVLVYDLWVANTDPAFITWNAQNLTPSPPLWDLVISLSPAIFFSIWGVIHWRKSSDREETGSISTLIIWAGLGLATLYLPIGLQRRFMMGLYVPFAGLAALGIEYMAQGNSRRFHFITICLFLMVLPTNLIILLSAQHGIQTADPQIYLSSAEMQALSWITVNTEPDALILSSPEMGLFIPAYTGRRVIYGHPFETVDAEAEYAAVLAFLQGNYSDLDSQAFLENRDVNYIFWGPREIAIGLLSTLEGLEQVFNADNVYLFKVGE